MTRSKSIVSVNMTVVHTTCVVFWVVFAVTLEEAKVVRFVVAAPVAFWQCGYWLKVTTDNVMSKQAVTALSKNMNIPRVLATYFIFLGRTREPIPPAISSSLVVFEIGFAARWRVPHDESDQTLPLERSASWCIPRASIANEAANGDDGMN
jgi:hypothetical protein